MKTILITGASSGFGKGAALEILSRGHRVIVAMRGDRARFEATFGDHRACWGKSLIWVELDVCESVSVGSLSSRLQTAGVDRVDVLINNAGMGVIGPIETFSESEINQQWNSNFFGLHRVTMQLLPWLRNSRGRVINISSVVGYTSLAFYGMYAATKHALEAYTEALAHELRPQGIDLALIEPGGFKTEFFSRSKQYTAASLDPTSIYFKAFSQFRTMGEERSLSLPDPQPVIEKMVCLSLQRSRVSLRHPVGHDAWAVAILRRALPTQVFFRLMVFMLSKYFR